jgi:hypothetical protein
MPVVLSCTLKAVCPKVEYNSSPGEQVNSVIRSWQESWANEECKMENEKYRTSKSLFNDSFLLRQDKETPLYSLLKQCLCFCLFWFDE